VRQRIQMILLREDGKTQPEIAELTGVPLSTVNRAHMVYDNGGVNALRPSVTHQRQHDRTSSKKNVLKPHIQEQWVIPPKANSAFVAAMEDVLEVYQRPHDPDHPLVCVDESSKQHIKETRTPIGMKPGQARRYDYEYERNGTANLFMMFAPLEGWRCVKVTHRHAAVDYAHVLKELSDVRFPHAEKIVLVHDNPSTHTPAALYEAFPVDEARRLVERFEWHYTPKHGSWLNLAESELGVLSSQCLNRRMSDKPFLKSEVAAWETNRNKKHTKANWQFTTQDARVKLKSLYPSF
jgi:DDE superfamily endonuclease/Homeodomain-like domain